MRLPDRPALNEDEETMMLNRLADDGWELVAVHMRDNGVRYFYTRRPKKK